MNKNILWVIAALVVIGLGVYLFKPRQTAAPTSTSTPKTTTQEPTSAPMAGKNTVQISGFAFSPQSITVKVGDSVTWTNTDTVGHSITADDSSFDTGVFDQNTSKTLKFDKAGTFGYHCSVHPNMKGTVVVE